MRSIKPPYRRRPVTSVFKDIDVVFNYKYSEITKE